MTDWTRASGIIESPFLQLEAEAQCACRKSGFPARVLLGTVKVGVEPRDLIVGFVLLYAMAEDEAELLFAHGDAPPELNGDTDLPLLIQSLRGSKMEKTSSPSGMRFKTSGVNRLRLRLRGCTPHWVTSLQSPCLCIRCTVQ